MVYAWDTKTAERLILRKADWIGCLGQNVRVLMPIYGVIISDIKVTDTQMANQDGVITRFWEENSNVPQRGDITRIRWLRKEKLDKLTNAMVVEFEDPRVASGLLQSRLSREAQIKGQVHGISRGASPLSLHTPLIWRLPGAVPGLRDLIASKSFTSNEMATGRKPT